MKADQDSFPRRPHLAAFDTVNTSTVAVGCQPQSLYFGLSADSGTNTRDLKTSSRRKARASMVVCM
jgi:hypothetical protein